MAETIEEFTWGNPHYQYRLEEGKRYRVPVEVAATSTTWDTSIDAECRSKHDCGQP